MCKRLVLEERSMKFVGGFVRFQERNVVFP
jgi:hypothetical protein